MSYDEYLLELDELMGAASKVETDLAMLNVLLQAGKANIGKLTLQEEHYAAALEFSKKKAKIVELQVFVNTRRSLDECRKQAYNLKIDQQGFLDKQKGAQTMLKQINNKIKSLKELETEFGKVLHHDFRGNTGTPTKR